MSVEALMEAPADPEAGARELEVEADLTRALTAIHDDLARHYARRTLYRKMNRHETASMQAYAEGPNGAPPILDEIVVLRELVEREVRVQGSRRLPGGARPRRARVSKGSQPIRTMRSARGPSRS
jgi:hypothetical protein